MRNFIIDKGGTINGKPFSRELEADFIKKVVSDDGKLIGVEFFIEGEKEPIETIYTHTKGAYVLEGDAYILKV